MQKTLLIESQILPPIPVLGIMVAHGQVIIEAHEHYQKRSFRNRIQLSAPQGRTAFSIPLEKGKHERQLITDVRISYDEDWPGQFMRILKTNYGSAPFFLYYIDNLENILSIRPNTLFELNRILLNWVFEILDIDILISKSESYLIAKNVDDNTHDMRHYFGPSNIDTHKSNVKYRQVYEDKHGFIANLSIIDMIMCCGPETILYFNKSEDVML